MLMSNLFHRNAILMMVPVTIAKTGKSLNWFKPFCFRQESLLHDNCFQDLVPKRNSSIELPKLLLSVPLESKQQMLMMIPFECSSFSFHQP
jgi:hypothetical protein